MKKYILPYKDTYCKGAMSNLYLTANVKYRVSNEDTSTYYVNYSGLTFSFDKNKEYTDYEVGNIVSPFNN